VVFEKRADFTDFRGGGRIVFYCLVGLPGSGKSTLAEEMEGYLSRVTHSSDAIREELFNGKRRQDKNEEVFALLHKRIIDDLKLGKNVCMDATNLSRKNRKKILDLISKNEIECGKMAIIMNVPFERCLLNNMNRKNIVPPSVMYKMLCSFDVPMKYEGWDAIVCANKGTQIGEELFDEMEGFDQKNPWHSQTLDEHCDFVGGLLRADGMEPWVIRAGLLHDIGKLDCQTIGEDGVAHYYNHAQYGAYRLLCELNEIDVIRTAWLVSKHMEPLSWKTEKARKNAISRYGQGLYNILVKFGEKDRMRPESIDKIENV